MKDVPIGEMIRQRRLELGMTQEELAEKMGYKHKSAINKIELGINDVSQKKIIKFAEVLGTTASYLMGWTSNPSKKAVFEHFTDSSMHILRDEMHLMPSPVNPYEITSDELNLIFAFRKADKKTQNAILSLLELEK